MATKPVTPNAFRACFTASAQAFRPFFTQSFLPWADAALDTTLPRLFRCSFSFVKPLAVFSFLPRKTLVLAPLPFAMTLFFMAVFMPFFIAFMPVFIAFMALAFFMAPFFMATAFMAFMGKAIADDAVQGAAIKHFDALKLEPNCYGGVCRTLKNKLKKQTHGMALELVYRSYPPRKQKTVGSDPGSAERSDPACQSTTI